MDKQTTLKYTEQMAQDVLKALGEKTVKDAVSGLAELAEKNGTFKVVISTEDVDRHGEIVKQDGLQIELFKKNPVVLFGHNHWGLPIAVCTDIYKETRNGKKVTVAEGVFASHTQAQAQRELYDMGVAATSIGMIEKERDGNIIVEAELIEFSFVPVPANPYVEALKEAGKDIAEFAMKGLLTVEFDTKTGAEIEHEPEESDDNDTDSENDDILDSSDSDDEESGDEPEDESDDSESNKSDDDESDDEVDDESDDDEPETDTEKILGALGAIDKRLSALENSKHADSDVADSESGESPDEPETDSEDEPSEEEVDEAVKVLRNRRKAQKAVSLLNEVLADMAKDAKKLY